MGHGIAHRERLALAATLAATGPGLQTLCADWDTAHLAAHLVLRDRRPDLQVETLVRKGGGRLPGALDDLATRTPYSQLVGRVEAGPPLSPTLITFVDDKTNAAEFTIHHEDVRRAVPGWEPRELPADLLAGLWQGLGITGRLAGRSLRVPTVLADRTGRTRTVRSGADPAVVTGDPLELTLFVAGRAAVARVEFSGPPDTVRALRETRFAF